MLTLFFKYFQVSTKVSNEELAVIYQIGLIIKKVTIDDVVYYIMNNESDTVKDTVKLNESQQKNMDEIGKNPFVNGHSIESSYSYVYKEP